MKNEPTTEAATVSKAGSKSKLIFTIFTTNDREYSSAHITILEPETWSTDSHRELMTMKWQSSASDRGCWYGASMAAESRDHAVDFAARLTRAAKLAAKLFPAGSYNDGPMAAIERLGTLGIERAAYDGRVSKYVRESAAIDPSLKCYIDDSRDGSSGCYVKGLAANDEEAVSVLEKEWIKSLSAGYVNAEAFAAWVAKGKPVRSSHFDKAPDYTPTAALLHQPALEIAA